MKNAVILFNLGGPDSLSNVKPFLYNLFSDKAIIRLPSPLRQFVAFMISSRREKTAQDIYEKMGGKSPIIEETEKQRTMLENSIGESDTKVFTVMRYWHPRACDVVQQVKNFAPDNVYLLPLYPQYSTTTTESSVKEWQAECSRVGLNARTRFVCCYPTNELFIKSHSELLKNVMSEAKKHGKVKVILSAHGLPEKVILDGDPYKWQIEQTVKSVIKNINDDSVEFITAYQSRVGPMEWIKPYTDAEILSAAKDGYVIVVVPIAFVSEHSETIVEIDMEYRHLAMENGARNYFKVPALGIQNDYIESLKNLYQDMKQSEKYYCTKRLCPNDYKCCPNKEN